MGLEMVLISISTSSFIRRGPAGLQPVAVESSGGGSFVRVVDDQAGSAH